jgi:hypothetical protein
MLGMAISDDGQRLWYGSPADGLQLSRDGGRSFTQVGDHHVQGLRYHSGALYIVGDWLMDGWALARIADGQSQLEILLRFQDIAGPMSCPANACAGWRACAQRWPAMQSTFAVPLPDSGGPVPDAGPPADAAVPDATAGDVPGGQDAALRDTAAMGPDRDTASDGEARSDAGCSVTSAAPPAGHGRGAGAAAGLLATSALLARATRRRRSGRSTTAR